jgi:hypothetical protein
MKAIENAKKIATDIPIHVNTYVELLEKIAHISYENPFLILYYRGQNTDYVNSNNTTSIYPSIYRGKLTEDEIMSRFKLLDSSSKLLVEVAKGYKLSGINELKRKQQIQWSILQHYGVCDTPYLDITHSLQVACTFAVLESKEDYGYIYVLGLPYLSNRITVNSEEDVILIRLLSISPPDAKRPYYQEGFVAGTTDITYIYDSKSKNELDFNSRLVGKFKFPNNESFWGTDFSPLRRWFLYPDDDKFLEIADKVKTENNRGFHDGDVGDFLLLWNELDEKLRNYSKYNRYESLANVIKNSENLNLYSKSLYNEIKTLNAFRNNIVHSLKNVEFNEISIQISKLKRIVDEIRKIDSM